MDSEASDTNRIRVMEERISGIEDTIKKIDISFKESAKSKENPKTRHPGNLGLMKSPS